MSSNTSVSPVQVPNPCKCGHDYTRHVNPGVVNSGTCIDCGNEVHIFTSVNEYEPSLEFQMDAPKGFFVSGGLGTVVTTTSSGVANTPGTTTITLTTTVGAVAGGTIMFQGLGLNQDQYIISKVLSPTTLQIPSPGLLVNVPNATITYFYGRRGSTMGAALPPNGQRAG